MLRILIPVLNVHLAHAGVVIGGHASSILKNSTPLPFQCAIPRFPGWSAQKIWLERNDLGAVATPAL
jgi:hypothetical protein